MVLYCQFKPPRSTTKDTAPVHRVMLSRSSCITNADSWEDTDITRCAKFERSRNHRVNLCDHAATCCNMLQRCAILGTISAWKTTFIFQLEAISRISGSPLPLLLQDCLSLGLHPQRPGNNQHRALSGFLGLPFCIFSRLSADPHSFCWSIHHLAKFAKVPGIETEKHLETQQFQDMNHKRRLHSWIT